MVVDTLHDISVHLHTDSPEKNQFVSAKVVLITAISSGQGKTTVTAALARKLQQQGQMVRVFKTGPDFIDPQLLERACGTEVDTLDLWMVGLVESRRKLALAAADTDVILIEGVMGLYDGTPSSADLALAFGVPVLAVLNVGAMAQTVGALALGLRDYGPVPLAGVIANKVASTRHAAMVRESMRDIPLFATLSGQSDRLPERHLGLVLPDEVEHVESLLQQLADQLELDQPAWDALPLTYFDLRIPEAESGTEQKTAGDAIPGVALVQPLKDKIIAIARDAAFAFMYPANLACLRSLGAELQFFSPLDNQAIPPQAHALYLPGGYPELHAARLQAATRWQESVRTAYAAGMPILAECGGMMAISEFLVDQQGQRWTMAGLLPGTVSMQARLAGLGPHAWQTKQGELRGHSFHYSRFVTPITPAGYAKPARSCAVSAGEAIYHQENLTASYFHAYFPSNPAAIAALFLRGQK